MSELKIKLKLGEFEIELEGDKETVQKEFNSLREKGLGEIFNTIPNSVSDFKQPEKPKTETKNSENSKTKTISSKKQENKVNSSRKKSSSSQSYSMLTDLNLRPAGKQSLEDFYNTFIVKSNMERNITILYFLKRILEIENVGVNHIYTCYKKIGTKVPNIYQGLIDTKNRKGWIDTNNMDDLKVSISGENYIEHEAPKKEAE